MLLNKKNLVNELQQKEIRTEDQLLERGEVDFR
jgi:hypothetical protein